jgi:hypothetical protein
MQKKLVYLTDKMCEQQLMRTPFFEQQPETKNRQIKTFLIIYGKGFMFHQTILHFCMILKATNIARPKLRILLMCIS